MVEFVYLDIVHHVAVWGEDGADACGIVECLAVYCSLLVGDNFDDAGAFCLEGGDLSPLSSYVVMGI